jgi:tellurite resistance protein TerC
MYFAVSRLMKVFRFLHYGLAAVLVLVGLKMLTSDYFQVSTSVMLGAVAGVILIAIAISAVFPADARGSVKM